VTFVHNDAASFVTESQRGFCAAHADTVRPVYGGVVRARALGAGKVALVVGGGSGHYPAFAGLVGEGLAAGAAVGNVFASPSARQICSVAEAADSGSGVLFSCGNYAGDALNFSQAQSQLLAGGRSCALVLVTDDIASAPPTESERRRGIAGGLVVFKIAGSLAEDGAGLSEVEEIARRANARTRSLGIAFSGCTLPGAREPLFSVPAGRMALGMGIHGEPGVRETEIATADGIASMLLDALLAEVQSAVADGPSRLALVLNGLGAVKYEELFVVYGRLHELLDRAGIEVVAPAVGEFVTSFSMAGLSLSVCALDEDLSRHWTAAARSAAFVRTGGAEGIARRPGRPVAAAPGGRAAGGVGHGTSGLEDPDAPEPADGPAAGREPAASTSEGSPESRRAAEVFAAAVERAHAALVPEVERLGRYDAVAGDGDHGMGMERGLAAAAAAAAAATRAGAGAASSVAAAADAWSDRAGGASGAIWGVALRAAAACLGDDRPVTTESVVAAAAAARDAVMQFGSATPGDKTLLDALAPFVDTLAEATAAGMPLEGAWSAAATVAAAAAEETARLVPRIGRARLHGARSVGTPDPGAVSLALVLAAVVPMPADGEQ